MPHFLPQPQMDISIYGPSNSFKSLVCTNTCIEIMITNVAVRTSCSVPHCSALCLFSSGDQTKYYCCLKQANLPLRVLELFEKLKSKICLSINSKSLTLTTPVSLEKPDSCSRALKKGFRYSYFREEKHFSESTISQTWLEFFLLHNLHTGDSLVILIKRAQW